MNETSNLVGYYETGRTTNEYGNYNPCGSVGKMDPSRKIGEIPEQLEIQMKKLESLSEFLNKLCIKLEPIRLIRPTDNMRDDYPLADTSPISEVLRQNNMKLQNIMNCIESVTDEIQL